MNLFERELLYRELCDRGHADWVCELREKTQQALHQDQHGKLREWIAAWNQLPTVVDAKLDARGDLVTIRGTVSAQSRQQIEQILRVFHPWRKGPFDMFGIQIDTEWRSCLKWNRLTDHLDLRDRRVLDVGCGNGYYGWKMLAAGARLVLGLDPFLLYLMQFEVVRKYTSAERLHFILPLSDTDLPKQLQAFDTVFSMGVLYHRTSPIDHLQSLREALVPGGMLVLESLVIEGEQLAVLMPEDRYAKMRNVWFIPSVPMLLLWLRRCGFRRPRVIDVSRTTVQEQRRTAWMTFESLSNFLNPDDLNLTREGYPAPTRAIVLAERG